MALLRCKGLWCRRGLSFPPLAEPWMLSTDDLCESLSSRPSALRRGQEGGRGEDLLSLLERRQRELGMVEDRRMTPFARWLLCVSAAVAVVSLAAAWVLW